jgi:hypothetical protein
MQVATFLGELTAYCEEAIKVVNVAAGAANLQRWVRIVFPELNTEFCLMKTLTSSSPRHPAFFRSCCPSQLTSPISPSWR